MSSIRMYPAGVARTGGLVATWPSATANAPAGDVDGCTGERETERIAFLFLNISQGLPLAAAGP